MQQTLQPAKKFHRSQVVRKLIKARRWSKKLPAFFAKRSAAQWCYRLGLYSFSFTLLLLLTIWMWILFIPSIPYLILILFWTTVTLLPLGVIIEIVQFYRQNQSFLWRITSVSGIISLPVSMHLANIAINQATGVDPSHFSLTVYIFTVIYTPVFWWMMAIFISASLLFISIYSFGFSTVNVVFKFTFDFLRNSKIYRIILGTPKIQKSTYKRLDIENEIKTALGRFFGLAILFTIIASSPNHFMSSQQATIDSTFYEILAHTGYNSISKECTNYNQNQGERVKVLGDGLISVAVIDNNHNYRFETRQCNL
ncbi:MAG TPA: hypothetical protein VFS21_12095 [Roseiflexaceae bacterium]|nr:hypothetical protein [Roseiflexaceae bacterium]